MTSALFPAKKAILEGATPFVANYRLSHISDRRDKMFLLLLVDCYKKNQLSD